MRFKKFFRFVLAFSIAFTALISSVVVKADSPSLMDEFIWGGGDNAEYYIQPGFTHDPVRIWTATANYTMTQWRSYMRKQSDFGTVYVSIMGVDGSGWPDWDNVLTTSQSVDAGDVSGTQWVSFTLNTPIEIIAGTQYATMFTVENSGALANRYNSVGGDTAGYYAYWSSGTWHQVADGDFFYQTYGTLIVPDVPVVTLYPVTYTAENADVWFWASTEQLGECTAIGFQVGTSTGSYDDTYNASPFTAQNNVFYAIADSDNFTYGETYYYRAFATNSEGTGYSTESSFIYTPNYIWITTGDYFTYGGATGNVTADFWADISPAYAVDENNVHIRASVDSSTWIPSITVYNNGVQNGSHFMFSSYNGSGSNEGQFVADTTYYYQAYATSANVTYYGVIKSFTPTAEVIDPKPDLRVISVHDISEQYPNYEYVFELTGSISENETTDYIYQHGFKWSLTKNDTGLTGLVYGTVVNYMDLDNTFTAILSFDSFTGTGTVYAGEPLYFVVFARTEHYGEIYSRVFGFVPDDWHSDYTDNDGAGGTSGGGATGAGGTGGIQDISQTVRAVRNNLGLVGVMGSWAFMGMIILILSLLFGGLMIYMPTAIAKTAVGVAWLLCSIAVVGGFVFTGELGIWPIVILAGGTIALVMIILSVKLSGGSASG